MDHYRFRTITPDGTTVFETTSAAEDIREAIAVGFRTAREVKSRQPTHVDCDTWFVDIFDPFGCWVLSLPLAMVSRESGTNDIWRHAPRTSLASGGVVRTSGGRLPLRHVQRRPEEHL